MTPRPPIVTILGHVDHGKTTLLDYIRKSRIANKEHGGITQKIGAYEIDLPIKGYSTTKITFIDTPGHEAFSQLRARGANVADIAILIIDAKDSLKPQTIESISHIKAAKIPFIVALNKSDLPDANPDKVKLDLLKYEVMVEDKGGTTPVLEISGKTGKGVDELLETILLMASEMNLEYDTKADSIAYIVETKKDRRGVVASAIIKEGVLKVGDTVYCDGIKTKVRSLLNDIGKSVTEVAPSTPFEILGFNDLPPVGAIITKTHQDEKEFILDTTVHTINMKTFFKKEEEQKKLSLLIKADSQGSLEAILYSLAKNDNITIILSAVGDIHRSDVFLAKTTGSVIIGFSVAVDTEVQELAKQEKTVIKTYNIIYELIEELGEVADLMLEKELTEKSVKAEAKIQALFTIEGEKIFGMKVTKGKVNLGDSIELHRGPNLIGKSRVISLRSRAKTVDEVKKDQEGGVIFNPPLDIRVGDVIKCIL